MVRELEQGEAPIDLMERKDGGIHVVLYWLRATNICYLTVIDEIKHTNDYIQVPNDKALDAFYHPFAYKK